MESHSHKLHTLVNYALDKCAKKYSQKTTRRITFSESALFSHSQYSLCHKSIRISSLSQLVHSPTKHKNEIPQSFRKHFAIKTISVCFVLPVRSRSLLPVPLRLPNVWPILCRDSHKTFQFYAICQPARPSPFAIALRLIHFRSSARDSPMMKATLRERKKWKKKKT